MDKLDDAQIKKAAIGAAGITLALGALWYMTRSPAKKDDKPFVIKKNENGKMIVDKDSCKHIYTMIMEI